MGVIWSDLETATQDYVRTPALGGSLNQGNLDRAINRAVEYFQRRLTLPSDRRIYQFYYTQSTPFYNLPVGFNESLGVYYYNQRDNIPARQWTFRPDIDMLAFQGLGSSQNLGAPFMHDRYWGFTTINQSLQIMMLGPNIHQPETIDPLNSIGTWTASGDASGLYQDTNIFQIGPSSLGFTITPNTGVATISNLPPGNNYDLIEYSQNNGLFQFGVYMGSTDFTSVQIKIIYDTNDYWLGTFTNQISGTPFVANQWNNIGGYFNQFVMTGSPNIQSIAGFAFIFNEGAGFTTTTTMHINNFFVTVPDYMNLVYNSAYKGYTAASINQTPKVDILNFNYNGSTKNSGDYLYFGDYAPDLIGPISKKAAIELFPQLRQDKDFMSEYKAEVDELVKIFGKIYPRIRKTNFGRTHLQRTTLG